MNQKLQQTTPKQALKHNQPPSLDRKLLDEQCEGDVLWEQRMKRLNPQWRLSEHSLWAAYHE